MGDQYPSLGAQTRGFTSSQPLAVGQSAIPPLQYERHCTRPSSPGAVRARLCGALQISRSRSYQDVAESPPPGCRIALVLSESCAGGLARLLIRHRRGSLCDTIRQRLYGWRRFDAGGKDAVSVVEIAPLRGIRFQREVTGPIGPLIAPPYDVVSGPGNGVEFSISAIENVDLGQPGDQHAIASARYDDWLASGVLRSDPGPALYLHRHAIPHNRSFVHRTGLLARVRLHDWHDRVILPHEATFPGPRAERLARLRAVDANLSPLYFLFRDPDGEVRRLLDERAAEDASATDADRMGGRHALVPLTDPELHQRLRQNFLQRTLFVADGHHRYEAALAHRDQQRQKFPGLDGPSEFVLALLVPVEDPGVLVRPTHRVLVGDDGFRLSTLLETLRRWFDLRCSDPREHRPGTGLFRVVGPEPGQQWTACARPGDPHHALMPAERGPAWKALGVSAVAGVLESLVGAGTSAGERQVHDVVDEQAAIDKVRRGSAQAAFLLPTPSLDQLLAVAEQGDLLPPKSSWFDPKAPAGLVINDLTRSVP